MEGSLISLLCSLRPHDQNVLPQCAQWETNSGLPPEEGTSELGGNIYMVGRAQWEINKLSSLKR